jgi:NADH-quinone oxidoreductase subunit A
MLRSYLPALVFVVAGLGLGTLFTLVNARLGPRSAARRKAREAPYESGMPSSFAPGRRFGVSFYVVGILFLIFGIEVVLLFPTAVVLQDFGVHGLVAVLVFIALLGLAFVYEWGRGALEWR